MQNVSVVGGGAAGMFAAIWAARSGHKVTLFERNEKLGKKLFITGKGRCNITNNCEVEELFKQVVTNSKFLYSSFYSFTNQDMIDFLENLGLQTKVERGNRVFPKSDKSSDVIGALTSELKTLKVEIRLNTRVTGICAANGQVEGLTLENQKTMEKADAIILCTGGVSYKTTGSTGDGHAFAQTLGLAVTELHPSLVPFNIREAWCKDLQGLSLRNVRGKVCAGKKVLYEDLGELLFTHFGISGPLILTASAYVSKYISKGPITVEIDMKPALTPEQLDERLVRDFETYKNKQFRNALGDLLPAKMIPVIVELSGIDPYKQVNRVSKEERQRLGGLLKGLKLNVAGLRDYNEAIITKGGISVKEVNPSTMECKAVKGLYFAGEVLDLDALTGGFNLQIAWSTAYLAGTSIEENTGA